MEELEFVWTFETLIRSVLWVTFFSPHIDMLVNSTIGYLMLSFMDGFSSYNKILMASKDMENTSYITYCYRVMSFGLKNARATY